MNDVPTAPLVEQKSYDRVRELYLYLEPSLMSAIRSGNISEARGLINQVLTLIYTASEERSDVLKGLLLELIVMMSRAAVEAGASQSEVLGINFRSITKLGEIDDDEHISLWLKNILEHIMSTIGKQNDFIPAIVITKALDYMRQNMGSEISRDDVARHAGISPSHFSRVFKKRTGRSFTESLRQCRVDLACELLHDPSLTLANIAMTCGFCDQSYFTNVFQESKGLTPGQYRDGERL